MTLLHPDEAAFGLSAPLIVIGGGACGMVAALSAQEAGLPALVLERDSIPSGSTGLSSGMIPAAGTRIQAEAGQTDSPTLLAQDIQAKSKGRSDSAVLDAVVHAAGPTIDWLNSHTQIDLQLVGGFLYPGHSVFRMHAPVDRSGTTLIGMLSAAAEAGGVDIVGNARVAALFADGEIIRGVRIERPDASTEDIACDRVILACNGFGGNAAMVARHIPEMAGADYFGHPGNQGDAALWGEALGGETKHMTAYQGHGNVASPHGILITWALMMKGGIQVNTEGRRFSNEHEGYSEQCVKILNQPGRVAWAVFDERLHKLGLDFDDYRQAQAQGAVRTADSTHDLAMLMQVPDSALAQSIAETHSQSVDRYGRDFAKTPPLETPLYAVQVGGYLFHTQGGLRVDRNARVVRAGTDDPLPNLYAGGGAACGVSGPDVDGYLSGNGLLTAVALGRLAGWHAAGI